MIKLNPKDFTATAVNIDEMLARIGSGNAVLFVGSGYSRSSNSVHGDELPTAVGLARAIGQLGGFDSDDDLRYAAERYIREGEPVKLVEMLVERFSVSASQGHHAEIAAAGWRRVYTTNYDLLIERAAETKGVLIKTVDLHTPIHESAQYHNTCVHLNGSIRSLTVDGLNTSFKLSQSSYLSPTSFLTSPWHFTFKKDLELASAIIFVGYSLYDIEVQRILYEMPEFKAKTYFVTHDQESEKQRYTLGIYGSVLPIGAEAFGKILADKLPKFKAATDPGDILSLVRYVPMAAPRGARDADVDRMLMYGDLPDELIDASSDDVGAPILVVRDAMDDARQILLKQNLVVVGEFGNGKSIFLRMLKAALAVEHDQVYWSDTVDPAQFGDIEVLSKRDSRSYVVIDDYEQQLDLIKSFAALSPANVRLIIAARTNVHERNRATLMEAGLRFSEVAVDQLSEQEVETLVNIFDNAGLWGDLASMGHERKVNEISLKHRGQISLSLLSILESPIIRNKVSGLIKPLLAVPAYRDTVFAISLLQALAAPLTASLISETALNDAIYSPELRCDENFRQLFRIDGQKVTTKSSLFALSILRHQFTAPYIVDHLLGIISSFGGRDAAPEKSRVFKELLRFSNVERLLPENNKKANLLRYYEELKRRANWLIRDPHFWLQYAMTQMQFGEYPRAQKFLDQAYALARAKLNYHTIQIDTQQARMWLEQSAAAEEIGAAYGFFERANSLLKGVPNDEHKFWQLLRYETVFDRHYHRFTKGQKAYFEQAVKNSIQDIDRAVASYALPMHFISRAEAIGDALRSVIRRILQSRQ